MGKQRNKSGKNTDISKESTSDYARIRANNKERYGTEGARRIAALAAKLYDNKAHFILELLQNAEDALAHRGTLGSEKRTVSFQLTKTELRVSHFGQAFNKANVEAICDFDESTKEKTDIGCFGIGFKSVYNITARPEIYSGREAFAIEDYVLPIGIDSHEDNAPDKTLFIFPFKKGDSKIFDRISNGLQNLDMKTPLFLRHIKQVRWSIKDGSSGAYLRELEDKDKGVRRVTIKNEAGKVESRWLIFSRPVKKDAGYIEFAFMLSGESGNESIQPIEDDSPLIVFFPTIKPTHLGFLLQGPYQTTPSRDNVPIDEGDEEDWNTYLIQETSSFIKDVLIWLRGNKLLSVSTLRCLPINSSKFEEKSMFKPLFEATKEALKSEKLLPRTVGGYISAKYARLGRTRDLRNLLNASQLATLLERDEKIFWISGDIDTDSDLGWYLRMELGVQVITPEYIIRRLNQQFLEKQTDNWIQKLYKFLRTQSAMRKELDDLPLIRLRNGKHVPARINGQPQAFMPSENTTDPLTVKKSVCQTKEACEFLKWMGITERDPVDDVVQNILPRYKEDKIKVTDLQYGEDIRRISEIFETTSKAQRDKLINALRSLYFVRAVDATSEWFAAPSDVYLATDSLKALFKDVEGIFIIDDSYTCLRNESVLNLLKECGAAECLRPVSIDCHLSWDESRKIRRKAGLERVTWANPIEDKTLDGLDKILQLLPDIEPEEQKLRADLLWKALVDVRNKHNDNVFTMHYSWGYSGESKSVKINPKFIDDLNKTAWIPAGDGSLQKPELIDFNSLGWEENSFLLSKIHFKPTIVEDLAREAGIDPTALDMIKQYGITADDLRSMINSREEKPTGQNNNESGINTGTDGVSGIGNQKNPTGGKKKPSSPKPTREYFNSYVGVRSDGKEPHMKDLNNKDDRMNLEEKAIKFIESRECEWKRTPTNNPGFDLYKTDESGNKIAWCEVKAMTGSLEDHPVGLSHTQFECAQKHRENYWLYVVENANTDTPNLVRINDPAGWESTFTFDCGWKEVSEQSDD